MPLWIVLLADLWLATPPSAHHCGLEHALLSALERYCASAAPSEQFSCGIVRARLRACATGAREDGADRYFTHEDENGHVSLYLEDGGGVSLVIRDHRVDSACGLFLDFAKRRGGTFRLQSFRKSTTVCDCDCCP